MTGKSRFHSDLQAITDAAATARREIESGQVVDLRSLESLADRVTTVPPDLTAEEAASFRKAILLLVSELDELRSLVQREHASLREQLEGTGMRRTAATAYGRPPTDKNR